MFVLHADQRPRKTHSEIKTKVNELATGRVNEPLVLTTPVRTIQKYYCKWYVEAYHGSGGNTVNYTVKLTEKNAEIVGLPDIYLHFAHLDFDIVWNPDTKRQDVVRGVNKFYGSNVGEGQTFDSWQDALHASLYDAYQVREELKDGDTFIAEYLGATARFACDGVHVVKV